jgi:nicotinamide-nucleotide amidase
MSSALPNSFPDLDGLLRRIATPRARQFVERCCAAKLTIAAAESLTGGAIGAAIAVIPGSGEVFKGSVVTYRPEAKYDVLGIRRGPVVTAIAAAEMARAAISLFGSDLAVAATGVAGPDSEEGVPVGTVFIAVANADYRTLTQERQFNGLPSDVRVATVRAAIDLLDWFAHFRTESPVNGDVLVSARALSG